MSISKRTDPVEMLTDVEVVNQAHALWRDEMKIVVNNAIATYFGGGERVG